MKIRDIAIVKKKEKQTNKQKTLQLYHVPWFALCPLTNPSIDLFKLRFAIDAIGMVPEIIGVQRVRFTPSSKKQLWETLFRGLI